MSRKIWVAFEAGEIRTLLAALEEYDTEFVGKSRSNLSEVDRVREKIYAGVENARAPVVKMEPAA
jgi:hypothetical protein